MNESKTGTAVPITSCELWLGAVNRWGYGVRKYLGSAHLAHRARFHEVFGWWPPVVRHTCDNPPCVNPLHLLPGTHADNEQDKARRGRGAPIVRLNDGLPSPRRDSAAYQREVRARKKAGTWVYRTVAA